MSVFNQLLPDFICDVVASQGYDPTGALYQLNSYENRVYEIKLERGNSLIAKFYRPGRWSRDTLTDEHRVLKLLEEAEVPVVRPLILQQHTGCETLAQADAYFYCFYKKFGGRCEQDLSLDHLKWMGRTLARLHNITADANLKNRIPLNTETYGDQQMDAIFDRNYLPKDLRANLEEIFHRCLDFIDPILNQDWQCFAVHGDCHLGNVLWDLKGPTLVDFDDMVIAPAVQDIWMLFNGTAAEQAAQQEAFFEGYEMFLPFDYRELGLVEPLRTLRMIRHAAWIGERFEEEIFKRTFPYYPERNYWEDFLLSMKEQLGALCYPER
ncbi:MAG: serine/threonine protein kinase [Deltaproteobacteria bacterium]|nr:serine/threonine protein kinase [Deltaproteobacteria bacterium]